MAWLWPQPPTSSALRRLDAAMTFPRTHALPDEVPVFRASIVGQKPIDFDPLAEMVRLDPHLVALAVREKILAVFRGWDALQDQMALAEFDSLRIRRFGVELVRLQTDKTIGRSVCVDLQDLEERRDATMFRDPAIWLAGSATLMMIISWLKK